MSANPEAIKDLSGSDQITILKSAGGLLLTKRWLADGTTSDYDSPKNFRVKQVSVSNIVELSTLLAKLEPHPDHCIIRGGFIGDAEAQRLAPPEIAGHYVRQNILFSDRPLHMLLIDADGFRTEKTGLDAILEYIETVLPPEFQGASFHWQLSSSAGHPRNAGKLKAHLWFWLATPRTGAELHAWALRIGPQVDKSVYRQVQVHYTAAPAFDEGVTDPLAAAGVARSGFHEGWLGETVDLVLPEGTGLTVVSGSGEVKTYPDARTKPGLIGAFNRAYTMDEVWDEFLPGQFERVPGSDRRVTWHGGGGAAEGCFVDDSGEWLVNTHNTDPAAGRASCKWDLVRLYLFGDRDSAEVKADTFDVTALPSHQAMLEMARNDERVQEAYGEGKREAAVSGGADWSQQIETAADESALRGVCDLIADDRGLDRVARELLAVRVKDRLRRVTGAALPIAVARGMVGIGRRVTGGGGGGLGGVGGGGQLVLPDISPQGAPQETEGNLEALCNHGGVVVRYNVIKKEDEILIPGEAFSMDNRIAASLTSLRSRCHQVDMKTGHLKKFVTLLADRSLYNPVAVWIDSRPWDGVSRIGAWFDTIVEDPTKITKELKHTLMTRWAISAILAAYGPLGVMARGVLTLQGVQYAGKTRWVLSLVEEALQGDLIKIGRNINPHDKDSLDQVLAAWIAELGEVDATFRKADIAALKAFLTNNTDEFRRAYAEAKSQLPRRTVFVASVNDDQFLVDPTGNSRFWTIPALAVNHEHGLDMQQVWAEFKALWEAGERHYLSAEEMQLLEHANETYQRSDPISEMLVSHLDWASPGRQWMQASDVLRWLGMKNPSQAESIAAGRALRKIGGGGHRKSNGRRLCLVPTGRSGHTSDPFSDTSEGVGATPDFLL